MAGEIPGKPDFPGLLPRGFHVLTLPEVRELCVTQFALSETRQKLMDNLCELVSRFESLGLSCDLWLDGSFATKKLNPGDIDVVARIPAVWYNEPLDSGIGQFLEWLVQGGPMDELSIDIYMFPDYPIDSPDRELTEERLAYWSDWFGTGRDSSAEKGIMVVHVCGGAA